MMYCSQRIVTSALVILASSLLVSGKHIFCYYSSFAQTRQSIGNFLPENIDPYLCTHIIFAFVDITPDGTDLRPFNRNDQGPQGLYNRTLALKQKNPNLKVLLAVGGWQIGSKPFIPMVREEGTRQAWIKNVVQYLRRHGFDGFDMDWEFPAMRGSPPEDKHRFTLLMKGLYEAFSLEAWQTGKEKLLLTLATASGTYIIDQAYEPSEIIKYVDFMLLMTYNYHGQWEKETGHHSGLWPHNSDNRGGQKPQLHQQWSIDYWLDVGIPKKKLIVGIPTYAMTFTLANPSQHGIKAPAVGGGRMGDITKETGIMSYYEVCSNLKDRGWQSEWLDDQSVPYAWGGDQWAGFENPRSAKIKAKNIERRDLAGAFVWSVEMDDFRGTCGEGQYPILNSIADVLGESKHLSKAAARQPAYLNVARDVEVEPSIQIERTSRPEFQVKEHKMVTSATRLKKLRRRPLGWRARRVNGGRKMTSSIYTAPTTTPVTTMVPSTDAITTASPSPLTHRKVVRWWPRNRQFRKNPHQRKWLSQSLAHSVTSYDPALTSKRYYVTSSDHAVSSSNRVVTSTPRKMWKKSNRRRKFRQNRNNIGKYDTPNSDAGSKPRMAQELVSSEVHEVKTWQTTPWWQSTHVHNLATMNAQATGKPGFGLQRHFHPQTSTTEPYFDAEPKVQTNAAGALDCHTLGEGTHPDPRDCQRFLICLQGDWMEYPPHVISCPKGTRFDKSLKICNHASAVPC